MVQVDSPAKPRDNLGQPLDRVSGSEERDGVDVQGLFRRGNETMKVTELRGDELLVTDEMRAQVFWLMQRFTSYTHLKRCLDVFSAFVKGYEGYAMADKRRDNGEWHRENLAAMYASRLGLTTGLSQVKKGQSSGYRDIRRGISFVGYFRSPRFGSWAPPFLAEEVDSGRASTNPLRLRAHQDRLGAARLASTFTKLTSIEAT